MLLDDARLELQAALVGEAFEIDALAHLSARTAELQQSRRALERQTLDAHVACRCRDLRQRIPSLCGL
jgi:hypothetical protein